MYTLTKTEINNIVEFLRGSCESIDNAICQVMNDEEIESVDDIDNELELCAAIDQVAFNCERCGWWCDVGDYSMEEDGVCSDCGDN